MYRNEIEQTLKEFLVLAVIVALFIFFAQLGKAIDKEIKFQDEVYRLK